MYNRKKGDRETGQGMDAYSDVVKGFPGSCTEGSVAFWANMKKLRENPVTGDQFNHYLLLVTYERSDLGNMAGHCLYLGERTDIEKNKHYFLGGINSFEDPRVEYDSIEAAVEANTDAFRFYGSELKHDIMFRPKFYCVLDPRDAERLRLQRAGVDSAGLLSGPIHPVNSGAAECGRLQFGEARSIARKLERTGDTHHVSFEMCTHVQLLPCWWSWHSRRAANPS